MKKIIILLVSISLLFGSCTSNRVFLSTHASISEVDGYKVVTLGSDDFTIAWPDSGYIIPTTSDEGFYNYYNYEFWLDDFVVAMLYMDIPDRFTATKELENGEYSFYFESVYDSFKDSSNVEIIDMRRITGENAARFIERQGYGVATVVDTFMHDGNAVTLLYGITSNDEIHIIDNYIYKPNGISFFSTSQPLV